jgi:sugar-phosphatase
LVRVQAEALLFDMDGVLVSSIASAERCWKRWAAHYGLPHPESFTIPHGIPARDIVKMSAPQVDQAEALRFIEDIEIADVSDIEVLRGAGALLASLPQGRWTIVTSAGSRLMEARVKAAKLPLPERWISADDVVKGKPDPEPYRKGAALLGFAAGDCVVVEDAPSGIKAGLAAGCRLIGVVTSHTREQVADAGATWVVESLEDVRLVAVEGGLRLELAV